MSPSWQVKAFDNFGAPGEADVFDIGVYGSIPEALEAAQDCVRESLRSLLMNAPSIKSLMEHFQHLGEESVIFSLDGGADVDFSARDYARTIAGEVFRDRHQRDIEAGLRAAYRATEYVASWPEADVSIRVGDLAPDIDARLATINARTAAFISAENPMSSAMSAADNEARHRELLAAVESAGWQSVPGVGRSPAGGWSETSLLVIGLSHDDAVGLARLFEQAAFIWLQRGQPASLQLRTLLAQYVDEMDLTP